MEIFVDFGLFELIGVVAVALLSRDPRVRQRMRVALARVGAELGRCGTCMAATAVGLGAAWWGYASLGSHAGRLARWPLLGVAVIFSLLSTLHVAAMLHRLLARRKVPASAEASRPTSAFRPDSRDEEGPTP